MTKNSVATGIDRRTLISGMTAVSALGGALSTVAGAQTTVTSGTFSFAVCGDSRPMMYLPYNQGKPDLVKLFVEMFGLVMPERVAEAVVKRDVKMIFDPATKDLVEVIMPFMSKTEVMTLSIDKGWVTRATVEDVIASGRAPGNVPAGGRRLGGARDRGSCPGRTRQIRGQQRRRRLVGQSGPIN
jgi:hypothetical protein